MWQAFFVGSFFVLFGVAAAIDVAAADYWTEDALQHDGRIVKVDRTVYYNFGRGDLSQALRRWPDQYSIRARHPDTGETVRWAGKPGWNPIMLGFLGKRSYLVLMEGQVGSDNKQYECPEIPYAFLGLEGSEWRVIRPAEFPKVLLRANLSSRFDSYWMKEKKHHTSDDIANSHKAAEQSSADWFSRAIPTSFGEWPSKYKNQYRVRARRGCEHLVPSNEDPSHPQWPGRPAEEVSLEILETTVYEPLWIIKGERDSAGIPEWSKIAFGPERMAKCRALIKRVDDSSDRPELRGWLLFVKDPTGNRKARGFEPIHCDDRFLWFSDYDPTDQARQYLSKFTHDGVLVYRLKFTRPDQPRQFAGHFMGPTMRAEGGYLNFEWWNTNQSGYDRQIARAMKVRVREPDAASGAK
jgi:hypothetical protein